MQNTICQDCNNPIERAKLDRLAIKGIPARFCENCAANRAKARKTAIHRRMREEALRGMGLTKVKGNLGGTYWE